MSVEVYDINGKKLIPCSERKARILLKKGHAKPVCGKPFRIMLNKVCK